ncbi:MAG TPA: [protein-PII] uridylyltransferase, partial [Pirellulaceae bacterium]|nr:[protein-PII] uridylyltransferase [Pirellulaceae bacterium]
MPTGLRLRPSVLAAREKLADGRAKLRAQHDAGSPGIQVCARLTDLLDTVLLDLYHDALDECGRDIESVIALAPYGGYGRRDVAPYSDVDLMLLHKPGTEARIAPFVRRLTQDIVDAGLDLGYSRRTPAYACSLALADATIFTSLVEARYLVGSVRLFSKFMHKFRKRALRRSQSLIAKIEEARQGERNQHGDTIYLLKPNVKRSRGGLRDLQMVRWIGFARWGEAESSSLVLAGHLASADRRKLRDAREFLLRLRNELHFHAGKSVDLLDRHEQVRIAELYKYEGNENQLPVERFMRDYIEHTSHVRYCAAHFVESAKSQYGIVKFAGDLFSHRMEGDFRVGPIHISATRRGKEKLRSDLAEVLRLMDLANRTKTRIHHDTWQLIRESMLESDSIELSPQAVKRFRSLLDQPGELGDLLRRLHEMRVLEKIIPPMAHARHLMQFNEYHKYTVDEHSIRAIESATEFQGRDDSLGRAYRKVKKKWLLHLALLMHDLGKGFSEDHSNVGARL